jgi:hypothetical protein
MIIFSADNILYKFDHQNGKTEEGPSFEYDIDHLLVINDMLNIILSNGTIICLNKDF